MASIQRKGQSWYCQFYRQNRRYTFSVERVTKKQAETKAAKTVEIVGLLDRGVLKAPEAVDVATFVKHDGRPPVAEDPPEKVGAGPSYKACESTMPSRISDHRRKGNRDSPDGLELGNPDEAVVGPLLCRRSDLSPRWMRSLRFRPGQRSLGSWWDFEIASKSSFGIHFI